MYMEPGLPLICPPPGLDVLYLDACVNKEIRETTAGRGEKEQSQAAVTLARFLHSSTTMLRKPAAAA